MNILRIILLGVMGLAIVPVCAIDQVNCVSRHYTCIEQKNTKDKEIIIGVLLEILQGRAPEKKKCYKAVKIAIKNVILSKC